MDRIWLDAPVPALCLRHGAVLFNDAARRWADEAGVTMDELQTRALAHERASGAVQIGPHTLQASLVPLPDGQLLWLQPEPGDPSRRTTEFLDRALVLAGVSVWRVDLRTRRIHFNTVGFQSNGMAQDAAGIDLDTMRSTIHPDDQAAVTKAAEAAIASDQVIDLVARYRNPDHSWRTLLTRRVAERDAAGVAVSLAGVSLDLTGHLAERERNRVLSDQARLVAEALSVGFWTRELETGATYWDEQMFRIHGRPRELGAPQAHLWISACVHPLDQEWMARRVAQADAALEPQLDLVFRTHDRGGQPCWVQSWACRGRRGGRLMAYGMQLDVTERKLAENLRLDKQRAEQASREKSAFMARMSHDLRTPMNAVLGFAGLLEADTDAPPNERQRERLSHISAAGQRLMAMIDGLLETAQREFEPAQAGPAGALHVLCVEDNPVNLQLVCELLALRPQVRLRTAVDGLSGVQAALTEPPDLLLLDLQLPDIDGLEVLRRVREQPSMAGCRIVALSADAMPDHIQAALAAGFDDYWTKPIQFDSFLAHIDRMAGEIRG